MTYHEKELFTMELPWTSNGRTIMKEADPDRPALEWFKRVCEVSVARYRIDDDETGRMITYHHDSAWMVVKVIVDHFQDLTRRVYGVVEWEDHQVVAIRSAIHFIDEFRDQAGFVERWAVETEANAYED